MTRELVCSKLHRATVTDSNLEYRGSITIDRDLMDLADLHVGQKVEVLGIHGSKARTSTYVIEGERGSKEICLNGGISHYYNTGDTVVVVAFGLYSEEEMKSYDPKIVLLNENNDVVDENDNLIKGLFTTSKSA